MTEDKSLYPSPYSLVKEFHETYGQAIRTEPDLQVKEKQMRIELIVEEADELKEANDNDDFIEIVDALADLLYVTYGALITHGIDISEDFSNEVSPITKVGNALPTDFEVGLTPDINARNRYSVIGKVLDAAYSYGEASHSGSASAVKKASVKIITAAYEASLAFGVDIDDVLAEVQRSNMSKLGEDGLPIYREDGKVLKGPNFFVPNIKAILAAQGW